MTTRPVVTTNGNDDVFAAVLDLLRDGGLTPASVRNLAEAVVVDGAAPGRPGAVVVAAVDDDGNDGRILRYAAREAARRSVPLRVVHVWSPRGTAREGMRLCRHDRMSDADRLLSDVLYDDLPAAEADAAEREIRSDVDAVHSLIGLSAGVSLLVIAARSGDNATGVAIGSTVRGLAGRTACPLAVLPPAGPDEWPPSPSAW
jgi:hypothetical protein